MRVPGSPGRAQHNFSMVPSVGIPRSVFNRSHSHKTTFDEGFLVPVFIDEALPGDTFHLKMTAFARLSTLLNPIMHNIRNNLCLKIIQQKTIVFLQRRNTPNKLQTINQIN